MEQRLRRWLTFNIFFALLPFIAFVLFHSLNESLSTSAIASSPEILFFALMVSATALGDMSDFRETRNIDLPSKSETRLTDKVLFYSWPALLLGSIVSALLYGAFLLNSLTNGGASNFQGNLLIVSICLALVFTALGTVVQVIIGRKEQDE